MDNKKKPRWKLNVFDVVLIAVVVVAAAALIFFWRASGRSSAAAVNTATIHYTIELADMVAGTADGISEGDTIFDSAKKYVMGTVVSVSVSPAVRYRENLETGDTVLSQVPGRETALITLQCEASGTASQISAVSGYLIRVGEEVQAAGPGYAGLGYIVAVEREALEQ